MGKIILLLFAAICIQGLAWSQVRIQSNLPLTGVVSRAQLWNLLVLNETRSTYECRINVIVKERNLGHDVLTAATGSFLLSPGAKHLNEASLSPIQYNYLSGNSQLNSIGVLPVGSYEVCYSISSLKAGEIPVQEECVSIDVDALSPPNLVYPVDSTILNNGQLQFSWIPPAPSVMFKKLNYKILITEVLDGQISEDAIQQNMPFYTQSNLTNNILAYPASAKQFEMNKWYAWQVVASDNNGYAGKTETWVFKYQNAAKIADTSNIYLLMEAEKKGVYEISQPVLLVKFFSQDNPYNGEFNLYNVGGNIVRSWRKKILPGENYFNFQVGGIFRPNSIYTLELVDISGKSSFLTFKLITQ